MSWFNWEWFDCFAIIVFGVMAALSMYMMTVFDGLRWEVDFYKSKYNEKKEELAELRKRLQDSAESEVDE